jgi:hypothetical protein
VVTTITVYVEGAGGKNTALSISLRKAFQKLAEASGLKGTMPAFVACGSGVNAYKEFCSHIRKETPGHALLLVDAEELPVRMARWRHVRERTEERMEEPPAGTTEDDLHLMVVTMEAWLLAAPPEAWRKVVGKNAKVEKLPRLSETTSKAALEGALDKIIGTSWNPKGKSEYAFKLLERVDIQELRKLPSAKRFFEHLRDLSGPH